MTEHIEWFEAVLNVTVGVYFRQQGFEECLRKSVGTAFRKMVGRVDRP